MYNTVADIDKVICIPTQDNYLQSRAALSLLAYCYFYMQDFVNAANCYEHLTMLFAEVEEYRLYYAQSLYQVS